MLEDKKKTVRWAGVVIWTGYLAALGLIAWLYYGHNAHYSVDDSYITYRYAFHLKEGYGLVFNVGERYYGTTAAGYAVLLALVSYCLEGLGHLIGLPWLAGIDVPQVSVLVSTLSVALIALGLTAQVHPQAKPLRWLACFAGTMLLFMAYPFNEVAGHETYAFLAAATWASVVLFSTNRPVVAAFLFALATSFRPDAALSVGAALLVDWRLAQQSLWQYARSPRALRLVLTYGVLLVALLATLAFYFGSPLPGTLAAKRVQVNLGYFMLYSVPVVSKYVANSLGLWGGIFVAVGWIMLGYSAWQARRQPLPASAVRGVAAMLSLGLFGAMSVVGYLLLNVTFWQWYGVPVVFSLCSIAIAGWVLTLAGLEVRVPTSPRRRLATGVFFLVLLVLAVAPLSRARRWAEMPNINAHINAYTEVADFIHKERPNGAVIQIAEPGAFAYRLGAKYKVVDELGLITPGVAQALARKDMAFLVDTAKPDYLVCSWKGSYTICDTPMVAQRFSLVGAFNKEFWQPNIGEGARLFRATLPLSPAMQRVKDVVLGDKWGKVEQYHSPEELFVHPGAKTETAFTIDCDGSCAGRSLAAYIVPLPTEAPPGAGSIGVRVLAADGSVVMARVVVDRTHPLLAGTLASHTKNMRVVIDNNGDPSYDWSVVGVH